MACPLRDSQPFLISVHQKQMISKNNLENSATKKHPSQKRKPQRKPENPFVDMGRGYGGSRRESDSCKEKLRKDKIR